MARILIDGRFIGIGDSVSRYTLEMLKGVLKIDQENQYTLLIRPKGLSTLCKFFGMDETLLKSSDYNMKPFLKIENCEIENLSLEVLDIPHYTLTEQTKLLNYLKREKFNLVHFTQFNHPVMYRGKYVITIHDLTMIGHLHSHGFHKRIAFDRVMRSAVKNSEKIFTVSGTTKKDVGEMYRVTEEKMVVTYNAVDPKYNKEIKSQKSKIERFREKYGIEGEYLLYTGMWKKHKNIMRMLSAFERLAGEGVAEDFRYQLVLVGKIDEREPEVMSEVNRINNSTKYKKAGKKLFVTTGFVEEDELPIAYAGALAYIIPSLSEGFGMPPLEAMACGTPVISSKESCMPEVLGDAAYYFDPYNTNEIKLAMKKILEEKGLREQLVLKGLEQVKKYSWDETSEKTLEVYKEVLKS